MTGAQLRLALAAPRSAEGFVSRFVRVSGLRLHVRERVLPEAAGPQWVLLHGLAVSHRYLMPTAAALPGRVHVPDLPGFGLSDKPHRVFDPVEQAWIVAAWMDGAGITGACVLGNSFGCQVAVELAVRRPDLVAALVLVGPTVDPASPSATAQAWRWARDLVHEDVKQARIIAADIRDAGLRRVLRTLWLSSRHRIWQRLPLVAVPVLVLRGEHDPIVPPRWAALAAKLAPVGAGATVPGAAHNAITAAGELVAARARAFGAAATSSR